MEHYYGCTFKFSYQQICCLLKIVVYTKSVMFLLGISENKATRKEFAIYRSNVVVPTGPGFFSLKTFCFAKMTSRVFNIVLEGSFQRSCYEPGSTMLKKRDVIEAKLKV